MSRLTDLIRQAKAKDPQLGADLEAEFRVLSGRRPFGLNFERHRPEAVELPNRPIRRGDKVRVLPPRGETGRGDQRIWRVQSMSEKTATLSRDDTSDSIKVAQRLDDLVVVAEFRDTIYPGLVSTGCVERGGDRPFHTVINGENFHVLEALTYTHRGRIDAIYIDPPYNTGAKDWKYNNDYVEGDDVYRHSKWLAFMERRLLLAGELLNPNNSVLIVTIDEKEYLRLGMLLDQLFPEARCQMVSTVINPATSARRGEFGRMNEYLFVVTFGSAAPQPLELDRAWYGTASTKRKDKLRWQELSRRGDNGRRVARPNLHYPLFVREDGLAIQSVGKALAPDADHDSITPPDGTVAVWPIRADGSDGSWGRNPDSLREALSKGFVRLGGFTRQGMAVYHMAAGEQRKVETGVFNVTGHRRDGSIIVDDSAYKTSLVPGNQWSIPSHDASTFGSALLRRFLPNQRFPFPKSLYAVEDVLRFFVSDKPDAVILDFFAGSGTTAHAVMRLNHQDNGRRQCISVTNNEVAADEQAALRSQNLRPGDPNWEQWGICEFITKPRIEAAIAGRTPDGEPVKGDYKFTDEFPMAEGFDENAEFFTLTYENPVAVG
ncbi:MAG: site-specific DNA-methyltransferase, partial [Bifidobacteriaceae bacterium]|nr:site-specific DNA-methyltransferase [Bifidobacteriaceae bacterium]